MLDRLKLKNRSTFRGFSLIELILVLAIIALLATAATQKFQVLLVKGKQGEAKANLKSGWLLNELYNFKNGSYATFSSATDGCSISNNDLEWVNAPCPSMYYNFTISGGTGAAGDQIMSLSSGCMDDWLIDNQGRLSAGNDAVDCL